MKIPRISLGGLIVTAFTAVLIIYGFTITFKLGNEAILEAKINPLLPEVEAGNTNDLEWANGVLVPRKKLLEHTFEMAPAEVVGDATFNAEFGDTDKVIPESGGVDMNNTIRIHTPKVYPCR